MTSGVAGLRLRSEKGRLSKNEVAGRENREKGQGSHEAAGPGGFSLAESVLEWGPGTLGEA